MKDNANIILVVDDEPSNLATLKAILEDTYLLVFARSGKECLVAVKKHNPALILLDIQMPDMDGYSVCRQLKKDPALEKIPVIFVSALSEVGDETAGFESGGVDYIIKPVSPALVRARVRTHLSLVQTTILERYIKQLELEQEKTTRLSRIHSVLSSTNSIILRIQEPQKLFEEACHIAVDQGGFGIAWIGLKHDNHIGLTLTACRGVEPESISDTLRLGSDVQPINPDLPHQVLMTGSTIFRNNAVMVAHQDRTCEDAWNRGYRSVIALPLCVSDSVIAVMVLYAHETNYFDEEELKLLGELAGDISFALQSIENEKRANFLLYYDQLTTLPNATLFLDRVDQLIELSKSGQQIVFIIALNLDHFKQLNDTYGRHIGDLILKLVGKRLTDNIPRTYSTSRSGADNFFIVGEISKYEDITHLCDVITDLFKTPLEAEGNSIEMAVKMGIAAYPIDAHDGETLFKNAELALKEAKYTRLKYLYYSLEINARMAEKQALEKLVKEALWGDQFVLFYQPKIDLITGKIIGAEALIRWIHPERGLVSPIEFIPLTEETGLIIPIGEWVIHTVCNQQLVWMSEQVPIVPVSLNLSAVQFKEGDILSTIKDNLDETGLEPHWLELELTETLVMQNPEEAEKIMCALREIGLHLSLDDFGTGYSSLAYLKRFPFDSVKIDKAFITDITHKPEDAAIASAIIGMAKSLRMTVIAEGVETEAQLKFLQSLQCNQMQGYYFSKPIPAEDFKNMLCKDVHLEFANDHNNQQTLLIVDDDELLLNGLIQTLRGQGYYILATMDSKTALELLALHKVQVVLCNQHILDMSGADFLTIVAKLYPDTMRIVLSGIDELESILDVVNRGEIYRFLTKPWNNELLKENILDAFKRYRSAA